MVSVCCFLFFISMGASAIARRRSPRSVKHLKLLAQRQRFWLLAVRVVKTTEIYEAQHSVPVDAHSRSSTFFRTNYLKIVWVTLCRILKVKRLEVERQRLSASFSRLSERSASLKGEAYPAQPRRWQRLALARGSRALKAKYV